MTGLEIYTFYDKPVPYKGLLIYPALMSEYIDFHWAVSSLLLDKNSTPDINVISMSYLSYLYYLLKNDDKEQNYKKMKNINQIFLLNV